MAETRDIRDLIAETYARAGALGVCGAFRGDESTAEEIFTLFKSHAGMEFCLEHDFPPMELLREYRALGAEEYGVYVDAGEMTLTNPGTVVLAGDTRARVVCDRLDGSGRRPCRVWLLHGASAGIEASGWAMVFVGAAAGCSVTGMESGHAHIIRLKL